MNIFSTSLRPRAFNSNYKSSPRSVRRWRINIETGDIFLARCFSMGPALINGTFALIPRPVILELSKALYLICDVIHASQIRPIGSLIWKNMGCNLSPVRRNDRTFSMVWLPIIPKDFLEKIVIVLSCK